MIDGDHDVRARLEAFMQHEIGTGAVEISGLTRSSYGFSRENWPFDATWATTDGGQVSEQLLLRRDPISGVLSTDRAVEIAVIQALSAVSDVPSPELRWVDPTGEYFERPSLIMTRTKGICDPFVLTGGTSGLSKEQRAGLARRFMELVALIHAVDWRAHGLDRLLDVPKPGTREAANAVLDHWEGEFRREAMEPLPELEFVLAWLRAHAPISRDTVLIHGDFKPGNTLLDGDEVVAVLDWETAHLGDPLEDLGWVTNPMRASEHQIPQIWERGAMIDAYRSLTGRDVAEADVVWWNIFSNLKLSIISLTGARSFASGLWDRALGSRIYAIDVMLNQIHAAGS